MNEHSSQPDFAAQRERLNKQIALMQERQRELVVQTALELDAIKAEAKLIAARAA